jgi:ABC-type multidrug transport system ATPase subunit
MISRAGLSTRYGRTLAVNDLSFDVLPGRITGSLGRNGAGKSTTMRMILDLDRPTSGTVTVDRAQVRGWLPRAARGGCGARGASHARRAQRVQPASEGD